MALRAFSGEFMNFIKAMLVVGVTFNVLGCVHDEMTNYHYQKTPQARVERDHQSHADVHRAQEGNHNVVVRTPRRTPPPRAEVEDGYTHRG